MLNRAPLKIKDTIGMTIIVASLFYYTRNKTKHTKPRGSVGGDKKDYYTLWSKLLSTSKTQKNFLTDYQVKYSTILEK